VTADGEVVFGSAIPDNGLEHLYDASESGLSDTDDYATFEDRAGSFDLDAVGDPTFGSDADREYAVLDGSNDAFDAGSDTTVSADDFASFHWIKLDSTSGKYNITSTQANATYIWQYFCVYDGELSVWDENQWLRASWTLSLDTWYFVGVAMDVDAGPEVSMYKAEYGDDTVDSEIIDSSFAGDTDSLLSGVGRYTGTGRNFDGPYSLAAFYSRIPSGDEIDQLFEATK